MKDLQKKLARIRRHYEDATLPLEARHSLELVTDLAEFVSDLETRVTKIEGRVNFIADRLG